jgi:hypothetical protein
MRFTIGPSSFRRLRKNIDIHRRSSIRPTIVQIRGGQDNVDDRDNQDRAATLTPSSHAPPPPNLRVEMGTEIWLAQGYTQGFPQVYMETLIRRGYIQLTEKCGSLSQFAYNGDGQRTPLMMDLISENTWNAWASMSQSADNSHPQSNTTSNKSRTSTTPSSSPVSHMSSGPNPFASPLESHTVAWPEDDQSSNCYSVDETDGENQVTAMRHPDDVSRSPSPAIASLLDLIKSQPGARQDSESSENAPSPLQVENTEGVISESMVRED